MEERRIPERIENCPLKEVVLEIRYQSALPPDTIVGIIYSQLKNDFENDLIKLPIAQLPEDIRMTDPSLRYQAYYQLKKGNYSLNIGPRSIAFAIIDNYENWVEFSNFFRACLKEILKLNIFESIERVGLRFINIFDRNLNGKLNLKISIANNTLSDEPMNIVIDYKEGEFTKKVRIGNNINMAYKDKLVHASVIDIDYATTVSNIEDFKKDLFTKIDRMHDNEKEYFFSLLTKEFTDELIPVYPESEGGE